jgi:hypothetical protein
VSPIPSRIHDAEKEDYIFKQKGDPLDDCMDALRCGTYTWSREPVKPVEIIRAEAMQGLDPTNAMFTKRKAEADAKRGGPPLPFGGQGNTKRIFDAENRKAIEPIFYGLGAARRRAQYKAALRSRPR